MAVQHELQLPLDEMLSWFKRTKDAVEFDRPVLPKELTLSSIPLLESNIASLTRQASTTKEERLGFTRMFDGITKEMMEPEKVYLRYVEEVKKALLPLKIEEDRQKQAKLKRAQDLVDFRIRCENDFNTQLRNIQVKIAQEISVIYKRALTGDLASWSQEEISESLSDSMTLDSFNCVFPEQSEDAEKEAIMQQIYTQWQPQLFLDMFKLDLGKALSGLEDDRKNIEAAEEQRKAVESTAKAEAELELEINVSYSENLNVVHLEPEAKTNKLKKVYVLTNARPSLVMKVFAKNMEIAPAYYKGRNFLDVFGKMIEILENMKNADSGNLAELIFEEKAVI